MSFSHSQYFISLEVHDSESTNYKGVKGNLKSLSHLIPKFAIGSHSLQWLYHRENNGFIVLE